MLVSSQTAVKGGHGFEIAVRRDNLRGGDWGEIQNHTKWSISCSKYALESKLVFGCFYVSDITNTEIQTWKEYIKYQRMRQVKIWRDFGVMNLYFGLFCSAGVLFNSSELELDFFLLVHSNAWQRNLKKILLIPILHMFTCLVFIHSKMWFQQQTSCLLVSLEWFWYYGVSYMFQKYLTLHSRSLNDICTVVIPGQILAR